MRGTTAGEWLKQHRNEDASIPVVLLSGVILAAIQWSGRTVIVILAARALGVDI